MNNTEPQVDRALEARVNLYYDLRPGTISPAPLLIALHGYGAHKRYMMREAELMAPAQFAIASLQVKGNHEIVALKIDPEAVKDGDVEMLQDMILAALNEANRKVDEAMKAKLVGMLPPGLGGLFG